MAALHRCYVKRTMSRTSLHRWPSRIAIAGIVFLFCSVALRAQFSQAEWRAGFDLGGVLARNGVLGEDARSAFRIYARRLLLGDLLQAEVGFGGSRFAAGAYDTRHFPIDARLMLAPHFEETWNPFVYVGYGMANYSVNYPGSADNPDEGYSGWSGMVPFGVGLQVKTNKDATFALDFGIGGVLLMADEADGVKDDVTPAYIGFQIGYEYLFYSPDVDSDGDGLKDSYERQIGTDPNNADTDGDGLKDGVEVFTHRTDPLNPDTDGDGLNDGSEVNQHHTNPLKADTDGDGLNDGAEVNQHRTNPAKADTDGDGLEDGAEVTQHRTDPLNPDTDNDGLKDGSEVFSHKTDPLNRDTDGDQLTDGEEVNTYRTSPLKADTDGDRLTDSDEIRRVKTDPLKPDTDGDGVIDSDDACPLVPGVASAKGCPAQTPKRGVVLNFSDIYFIVSTDKFDTTRAETEENLRKLLAYVNQCEGLVVAIEGHASREGNEKRNQDISAQRARHIQAWLIEQGVAPGKIQSAEGFGSKRNAVPEPDPKSAEARRMDPAQLESIRKQNRRIAVRVVKGCD